MKNDSSSCKTREKQTESKKSSSTTINDKYDFSVKDDDGMKNQSIIIIILSLVLLRY
jgi:hypothetical protein